MDDHLDDHADKAPVSSHETNASGTFVLTIVGSLVRFGSALVFNLVFGTAGFGRLVVARTWGESIAAVSDLGGRGILNRLLPAMDHTGRASEARTLLRRYRVGTIIRGSILGLGTYALLRAFGEPDRLLIFGFVLAPILGAIGIEKAALQARGSLATATLIADLIQPVILLVLVAALPLLGQDSPGSGLLMIILSSLLGLMALYGVATKQAAQSADTTTQSADTTTQSADTTAQSADTTGAAGVSEEGLTLPLFVTQAALVISVGSPILIVDHIKGHAAAAVVSMAFRVVSLVQNLNMAVEGSAAPLLSKHHSSSEDQKIQDVIDESISLALLPTIILSIAALIGSPVLLWFMGTEYLAAWLPLGILLLGAIASAATGPSGSVLLMTGKAGVFAWLQAASTLFQVVASIVLTHYLGLPGTAIAVAVSIIGMNLALGIAAQRVRGLSVRPNAQHIRSGAQTLARRLRQAQEAFSSRTKES